MKSCLSEETLLLLHEGEGSRADRAHLAKCQVCTIRYERLVKDLKLLGQVLRELPPQAVKIREHKSLTLRWVSVVTAAAAAALLLWSLGPFPELKRLSLLTWPPSAPTTERKVDDEELARFVTKVVSPAIFSTTDLTVTSLPKRATNVAYLQAALDGAWPVERCEGGRTQNCDNDPFALLFDQRDE